MLSIPFILAMTLPMAVLVAVLYTFNQLASDNEISAMKASGVSMSSAPVAGLSGGHDPGGLHGVAEQTACFPNPTTGCRCS